MKTLMKQIVAVALVAPGAALAHPGHPELAGPAGHDLAHGVMALGIAAVAVAGLVLLRRLDARQEE